MSFCLKWKTVDFLLTCIVLLVIIITFCMPVQDCYYKSVNDATPVFPMDNSLKQTSCFSYLFKNTQYYQIRDGKLFLLVLKVTSNSFFLAVHREEYFKDIEVIQQFSNKNPQLKDLWPDKNAAALGVKWLNND